MTLFVSYILVCQWKNKKKLETTSPVSAHTSAPCAGHPVTCGRSDPLPGFRPAPNGPKKEGKCERRQGQVLGWGGQGVLNLISAFFFLMHKGLPIYLLTKSVQI